MKKRKYLFLLVILFGLGYFFYYLNNGTERKVKDGTIQYSEELGWINWGHAKPESTQKSWENFQIISSESVDSFLFSYSQKMKYALGSNYYVIEFKEKRKFKPLHNAEEEKLAFLEMFCSVSIGFEKLQGKFPYIFFGSNPSSFRKGDLTGNIISYYLATSEVEVDEIKTNLTLYNKAQSYSKYLQEGIGKSYWESEEKKDNLKNGILRELQVIMEGKNKIKSFSTLVSEKEIGYFE